MKDKSKVLKTYGYMFDKLQLGLTPYPPLLEERGTEVTFFSPVSCLRYFLKMSKKGDLSPLSSRRGG